MDLSNEQRKPEMGIG